MTCFWDALLKKLNVTLLGLEPNVSKEEFISSLKERNVIVTTKWQGEQISFQQALEHYKHVKNYDISLINQGHLTGACDSFLLLVCELFRVDILFHNLGTPISYETSRRSPDVQKISFSSTRGHFS